jgi:hypothetical protein
MRSEDGGAYFGRVLLDAQQSARTVRAAALAACSQFLERRYQAGVLQPVGPRGRMPAG